MVAESADLVADLVSEGVPTLAFVRSRHGAEILALQAKAALSDVDPALAERVAPYRGGYLPEDRREIERQLRAGDLLGVAATNALELGIDIAGLDAVVMAGYPGTRSSLWQQIGRAGRGSTGGLGVLVARDDPLDTYLVTHPEVLLDAPVEATVFDSGNPYVVAPHLCAAAQELPLTDDDLAMFDGDSPALVASLVEAGYLRRRTRGWFWTRRDRAADLADIRSTGGNPVRVVEASTGRLIGTVDNPAADTSVHTGAVYVHFGETYLVREYDVLEAIAFADKANPDYSTMARVVTDIRVLEPELSSMWGEGEITFGAVEVSSQAVGFLKRRVMTGEVLGEEPLSLPARQLRTKSVWWTLSDERVTRAGLSTSSVPGAVHAAEHAAIGLLPLFATCDRWDIGGRIDGPAPGYGTPHGLRVRRASGRRRIRRTGLRRRGRLAHRHSGRYRRVPLRRRLPVVCPVPQVRQRQQPARQMGSGAAAHGAARWPPRLLVTASPGGVGCGVRRGCPREGILLRTESNAGKLPKRRWWLPWDGVCGRRVQNRSGG